MNVSDIIEGSLREEVRRAILLFSALFIAWQVLYFIDLAIGGLDWLVAYLAVLAVMVCFFVLDKQKVSDLGLTKPRPWKRYAFIGFMFAVVYVIYWARLGALIFSTGPTYVIQHGILASPTMPCKH